MHLETSDLVEVFQTHSQYKPCFCLKVLLETQEIWLNLSLGLLLKFDGSTNENLSALGFCSIKSVALIFKVTTDCSKCSFSCGLRELRKYAHASFLMCVLT